jgi:hypothetical protein
MQKGNATTTAVVKSVRARKVVDIVVAVEVERKVGGEHRTFRSPTSARLLTRLFSSWHGIVPSVRTAQLPHSTSNV